MSKILLNVFNKIKYFLTSPRITESRIIDIINATYTLREKELREEIKNTIANYHNQ